MLTAVRVILLNVRRISCVKRSFHCSLRGAIRTRSADERAQAPLERTCGKHGYAVSYERVAPPKGKPGIKFKLLAYY